jgi:ketosteroid isomerase-like protein
MRAVFEALGRNDMETLISHWAEDGIYYNPNVGPPAEGKDAVYATIARLANTLQERGDTLVIDKGSEVLDVNPVRAFIEWHIESSDTSSPRHGKLGIHAVSFNEAGLLHRVNVFSHP